MFPALSVISLQSKLDSLLSSHSSFIHLEIARSEEGISLCQKKYVLDLLESIGFLGCKPPSIKMEPNQKISKIDGILINDSKQNRKLVGKLQYLTYTRPELHFLFQNWLNTLLLLLMFTFRLFTRFYGY